MLIFQGKVLKSYAALPRQRRRHFSDPAFNEQNRQIFKDQHIMHGVSRVWSLPPELQIREHPAESSADTVRC